MATPLRFGRNLQSLDFTSDITNRATRLMPLTNPIGGDRTFLGSSRWKVTNNTSGVLTLADPAGGPGPVAFDDQLNAIGAYYLFREITAQAYAITDSAFSPNTVTITGDPGIAVGEFVQFRTSATAGTPIAVGPGGGVGTLSRGYILPLLATGLSGAVLTIALPIAAPAAPTADGQYVGDDVAFSNFVQTSTAGFTPSDGWPNYTVTWVSGTDFSGLAVGDWLITGDLSIWEGGGGSGSSLPPMTVTAVTDSTHIQVTVRGTGPSFAQGVGSTPLQFFRPVAANLTGTVTASSASAHTVTVDDATSLVATTGAPCALELSYTPVAGELPYYLDHPVYAATPATPTDPGIGIKFGTIDRGNLVAVPNLSPNALARHWTAGVPDGYTIAGSGATMTENTDPLFTELGGSSILVTFGGGQQYFDTPPIAWRPGYKGQRFSARAHLLIPALWSGNAILDMRFGIVKADGTRKIWFPPDPQLRMMPPDAVNAPSDAQKPAQGAWFDAVIHGFDITTAQGLGDFSAVGQADLTDAVAYFVRFYNTQGVPPFYFDGISITPSDVAVDQGNITEFGQANNAWQDTNVALSLLGKPQQSIGVDVLDLYALNPDSVDAIDKLTYPGDVLAHAPDLGLVNESQRIVEIVRNLKRPGAVRITLGQRLKRFTDLFVHQATAQSKATAAATTAAQSSGNGTTTVTPPSGSGTPPGGTTGSSLPAITLGVALDSSNVPTATAVGNSVVVRVKFAGRTDRFPTADETRAEISISPAPFTESFASILPGQTQYVSALAYDAAGNESALGQAQISAAGDATDLGFDFDADNAVHSVVSGVDVVSSVPNTAPAANRIGADLSPDAALSPLFANRPELNGNAIIRSPRSLSPYTEASYASALPHTSIPGVTVIVVARPIAGTGGFTTGGQAEAMLVEIRSAASPFYPMLGIGVVTAGAISGFRPGATPNGTTGEIRPYIGGGVTIGYFIDSGDVWSGVNTLTNFDDQTSSPFDIVAIRLNGTTGKVDFMKNGVFSPNTFTADVGPYSLDAVHVTAGYAGIYDRFDWARIAGYARYLSDDELRSAMQLLSGQYGTPLTGGTAALGLTAVRSGGDVIVTADARFASSVKIAASLIATPSDADVRATTEIDPPRPFTKTFAAPSAGETLHIKAFAYYAGLGGIESAPATLNVPSLAGTFGGGSGGDGTVTVPVVTTDSAGNITGVTEETISVGAFTPTRIPSGEQFTVPADKQVLFRLPIRVQGNLVVRGDLIQV